MADIGYRSVAITIDHNALPPYASHRPQRLRRLQRLLEQLEMRSVIETGRGSCWTRCVSTSRPWSRFGAEGRGRRRDFYRYAVIAPPSCTAIASRSGREGWPPASAVPGDGLAG